MSRSISAVILLLIFPAAISGQKDTSAFKVDSAAGQVYLLQKVERNGEVLPEVEVKEVTIVGRQKVFSRVWDRRYDRLIYNIKKVYPYAVIVREKLYQVNQDLAGMKSDQERRKYLREVEKNVLGEYEDDIRGMTITQGIILIKLIDRETRNTSYDLIREYRGSFSAVFWQAIARIFGTSLKAEYDPYGEDALIELIVLQIESGQLGPVDLK